MIFTKPIEFKEALQSRKVKKLMPTAASSLELEGLEPAIRERAFFMARVNHAGLLGKTDSVIASMLEEGVDINSARAQLKLHLKGIGYDPDNPPKGLEPAKPGSLRDLSSDARLNLVLDTNLKMANGYGRFAKANDPDIVDAFPVWELVRDSARKEEREWHSRWVGAGGTLYGGGRMMARKDDPIWSNLGPFKLPYPPFDYNSGMGVEEIDRAEAEALGIVKPSTVVEPQSRGFNDKVVGRVSDSMDADLRADVLAAFGDSIITAGRMAMPVKGLSDEALLAAKTVQAEEGRAIMREVIDNQADATNAMKRADIADPIDFRWGDEKKGIAHVIRQRDKIKPGLGDETAMKIPDVVALGKIVEQGEHKITLALGTDRVVLVDDLDGMPVNRWVLTAFKDKKEGTR